MKTNVISQELRNALIGYCGCSFKNEKALKKASKCFCYTCGYTYSPHIIDEWCTEHDGKRTAICPFCGIDSVVPIGSGTSDHPGFIRLLNVVLMGTPSGSITADDLYYIDKETGKKVFFEASLEETPRGDKQIRISNTKCE